MARWLVQFCVLNVRNRQRRALHLMRSSNTNKPVTSDCPLNRRVRPYCHRHPLDAASPATLFGDMPSECTTKENDHAWRGIFYRRKRSLEGTYSQKQHSRGQMHGCSVGKCINKQKLGKDFALTIAADPSHGHGNRYSWRSIGITWSSSASTRKQIKCETLATNMLHFTPF